MYTNIKKLKDIQKRKIAGKGVKKVIQQIPWVQTKNNSGRSWGNNSSLGKDKGGQFSYI